MQDQWSASIDYVAHRWARAVLVVTWQEHDVPTLPSWADLTKSSPGALRALCRMAHTRAKPSLDFARVLRAVVAAEGPDGWILANLLNVHHERTLERLVRAGGLQQAVQRRRAPAVGDFLSAQTFVTAAANLRAVGIQLGTWRPDAQDVRCQSGCRSDAPVCQVAGEQPPLSIESHRRPTPV